MTLATPVVLIIFNRPHLTEKVFAAICAARPTQLLVIADGPRFQEETEKCEAARSVIDRIDWRCEVKTNFIERNLGCRHRVASGLEWVFSQVDEAIILEDDCLPNLSFFRFCETLLNRYRHDDRVMEISGSNWQLGQSRTEYSYYFSKHSHTWGWATWKRAWAHYDEKLTMWPRLNESERTRMWKDLREKEYWESILDRVYGGEIDTWDYQWQFSMWLRNGLSAIPNANLVSNIGFGRGATHTMRARHPLAELPRHSLEEIYHPLSVTAHEEADKFLFEQFVRGKAWKRFLRNIRGRMRLMAGWMPSKSRIITGETQRRL